jgi:protein-S-isoprenylcysteine O-methyltransferase Ste14
LIYAKWEGVKLGCKSSQDGEEELLKYLRAVVFCIATLVLYLGVTLLGWGFGDLIGYFSNPARFGYVGVVALFSMAVGVQAFSSIEGIRGRKGEEGKFVIRQRIVRVVLELSLYLTLFFLPFFDRRAIGVFNHGNLARWLGVVLTALGFGFVFWSGVALGRQYSADVTIQEDHHLITSSVYRVIRHPRYLGVIALSIGVSLIFRSWVGLVASLVFFIILFFRIRDEEATMRKEFGVEWDAYCKRSWRLIPYIY